MATVAKKPASKSAVTGKVATRVPGFVLVAQGRKKSSASTPVQSMASALVPKLARALSKPGISRDAVFKGQTRNVYSYSVDINNTDHLVRVDAAGKRQIGRFVGNRFVVVKAA